MILEKVVNEMNMLQKLVEDFPKEECCTIFSKYLSTDENKFEGLEKEFVTKLIKKVPDILADLNVADQDDFKKVYRETLLDGVYSYREDDVSELINCITQYDYLKESYNIIFNAMKTTLDEMRQTRREYEINRLEERNTHLLNSNKTYQTYIENNKQEIQKNEARIQQLKKEAE